MVYAAPAALTPSARPTLPRSDGLFSASSSGKGCAPFPNAVGATDSPAAHPHSDGAETTINCQQSPGSPPTAGLCPGPAGVPSVKISKQAVADAVVARPASCNGATVRLLSADLVKRVRPWPLAIVPYHLVGAWPQPSTWHLIELGGPAAARYRWSKGPLNWPAIKRFHAAFADATVRPARRYGERNWSLNGSLAATKLPLAGGRRTPGSPAHEGMPRTDNRTYLRPHPWNNDDQRHLLTALVKPAGDPPRTVQAYSRTTPGLIPMPSHKNVPSAYESGAAAGALRPPGSRTTNLNRRHAR